MPAVWTAPITWAAGLVDETDLNQQFRDNLLWLKERVTGFDSVANESTLAFGPFEQVAGLTITKTTTGGKCEIVLCCSVSLAAGVVPVTFDFAIDSVLQNVPDAQFYGPGAGIVVPFTLSFVSAALSAASHTFDVYWQPSTQVASFAANTAKLYVEEVF